MTAAEYKKLGLQKPRRDVPGDLMEQLAKVKIPAPEREVLFWPGRRFRFDLGWRSMNLAVECEGGTWVNGAHNRGKHYESDCRKYSEAALRGWTVLRFTTGMVDSGEALGMIERAFGREAGE